jgi:hypothetical protein
VIHAEAIIVLCCPLLDEEGFDDSCLMCSGSTASERARDDEEGFDHDSSIMCASSTASATARDRVPDSC